MTDQSSRRVSLRLALGVLVLPGIFFWFLLRKGYRQSTRWVAFGWMIVLAFCFALPDTSGPGITVASSPSGSTLDGASSAPVPSVAVDPAAERERNRTLMADARQRLEKNREKLKGHYANGAAIERSSDDLHKLTAIAVSRGMSEAKEDQQQAAQAKALAVQVAEQIRVMYASSMEEGFVKKGIDARISAIGKGRERLHVSYALMSKPMVYKFQNEDQLPVQARALGFKQIEYTNGFDSELGKTWMVDL